MNTKYAVRFIGDGSLLMHQDNIRWCERVRQWIKDPANKGVSIAGDDRTPAWTWLGYLYHDDHHLAIDSDNIMSTLRDGGKKCPAPTGRGSMKVQTQSGILCNELFWKFEVNNKLIPLENILALADESNFEKHTQAAKDNGFELFLKRARIGNQKHIRVRPRFENWSCYGTITVLEPSIDKNMLQTIFNYSGVYAGLCDWRPGSPSSPGQFGKFTAEIKEI